MSLKPADRELVELDIETEDEIMEEVMVGLVVIGDIICTVEFAVLEAETVAG